MGCRDISGIQNSLQLKLVQVNNFKPEVLLKKHNPFSELINLNIDRLGRSTAVCIMIITIVFSEKVIILLFKDGGGQGDNPRQKCKQFQTKP